MYFRSFGAAQIEQGGQLKWFVGHSAGYLIEQFVIAFVCIRIAQSARKVLENLNNTQQVAELVSECNQASMHLMEETEGFKQNMSHFQETNEQITASAKQSLEDCDSSEQLAQELTEETQTALKNAADIRKQSSQMVTIAQETFEKLGEYISFMTDTASSMQKMRETAWDTEQSIESLKAAMSEVSEFAQTIGNITTQTNSKEMAMQVLKASEETEELLTYRACRSSNDIV